jgi:integrase/recombinase XerD
MSPVRFESSMAERMAGLVDFKRIQGYDYSAQAEMLRHFDRFLCREAWPEPRPTADLLQLYVKQTEPLAPNTRIGRLSVVRVFCRFAHWSDPAGALLHHIPAKRPALPRFHLYSPAEVKALLSAALQLGPVGSLRPHCFHMLIGLVAVTGLRINEAMGLDLRDLEAAGCRLFVRHGKFGKQRHVALHRATVAQLQAYLHIRQRYGPHGPSAPLFPDRAGKRLSYDQARSTFATLRCRAHVGSAGAPPPRLHDLRHTYACNCLEKWRREGADVNAKLPLLATAMGHTKIEHTQIYLHVTPEQLGEAAERLRNHMACNAVRKPTP